MFTNYKQKKYLKVFCLFFIFTLCFVGCGIKESPVGTSTPTTTNLNISESSISKIIASLEGLPLEDFFTESLNQMLLRSPETLTYYGLAESFGLRNDRLDDLSDSFIHETQTLESAILDLLHTYDREVLTPEQRLNYDVYEWFLDDIVRGHPFLYHRYQLHQFIGSYQSNLNELLTRAHPLRNSQDVEDYISRLSQVNHQVDQLLDLLAKSESMGIIPPKFIVELTQTDLLEYLHARTETLSDIDVVSLEVYTHLQESLENMDGLSPSEKHDFLAQVQTKIEESYVPAFLKMLEYLDHLHSIATDDAGVWKLPNGEAYYAYLLHLQTSTDLTPEEIHNIGLAEVDQIHEEMRAALIEMGYSEDGDLADMLSHAIEDFGYYEISTQAGQEEMLKDCKAYIAEIEQRIGEISHLQPAFELVVKGGRVPEFYYSGGLPGVRPGMVYISWLGDQYPKLSVQSIIYHEAIPGHYYQDAIMKGIPLLPLRYAGDTGAYAEGWALYAEKLAWEIGMYDNNPYGNIGRLQEELLRAVRLVVDTGIHAKGWTREEAITYVDQATLLPGLYTDEVDRYIVIPGQATSYMVGMLKILELRQEAMDALGDQFDLVEFHDVVLGNGSLPLGILEQVVQEYIDAKLAENQ